MPNFQSFSHDRPARQFTRINAIVLALLLWMTSGCDALDVLPSETISLNTSRVICFEFTGLTTGSSKSVVSSDSFDLDSFLAEQGFSKSEILGAEVDDITIRLRFPGQSNLSVFDEASISLRAGAVNTTIGSATDLGTGRTAILPTSGNDLARIVSAASFQGVLDVTGASSIQDDFLVEVEVEFSVEVEGI